MSDCRTIRDLVVRDSSSDMWTKLKYRFSLTNWDFAASIPAWVAQLLLIWNRNKNRIYLLGSELIGKTRSVNYVFFFFPPENQSYYHK